MIGKLASAAVLLVLINLHCTQASRSMPGSPLRPSYAPWREGRCAMDAACDSCPDDKKTKVWTMGGMMSWFSRDATNTTRTVCCQGCRGKVVTKQGARTYSCMCYSEEDTCRRNSACDKCDQKYVTEIKGMKYCCEGCKPASVSFGRWGMSSMGKCMCNVPTYVFPPLPSKGEGGAAPTESSTMVVPTSTTTEGQDTTAPTTTVTEAEEEEGHEEKPEGEEHKEEELEEEEEEAEEEEKELEEEELEEDEFEEELEEEEAEEDAEQKEEEKELEEELEEEEEEEADEEEEKELEEEELEEEEEEDEQASSSPTQRTTPSRAPVRMPAMRAQHRGGILEMMARRKANRDQ